MIKLPPHGPGQTIGLFGGSFNPAHRGHREVATYALKRLQLDWVWWLVSPQNPLKSRLETADYQLRLRQARDIANHPKFVVSDIEKQLGSVNTYQTLMSIRKLSDAHFIWIMGADSLADFDHWHRWEDIAEQINLAVLARPGHSIRALESKAALRFQQARIGFDFPQTLRMKENPHWAFISMPLRPESSTALRLAAKAADKAIS